MNRLSKAAATEAFAELSYYLNSIFQHSQIVDCLSLCTTYKIINELVDFTQHTKLPTNLRSSNTSPLLPEPMRSLLFLFHAPFGISYLNILIL